MPRCREFRISDYLVALVVVPLVSLAIIHRWMKNRAARKEEIKKLLIYAGEEAARAEAEAEAEATAFYYCSSATVDTKPQCVVCFSPTTTRCSRCKAVRYCSGKCQIIHWRQGHKYDCHPPDIDDSNASAHVSTHSRELSSVSFTDPQNISSYEDNDGSRNSDATIEKVIEPIAEKVNCFASKRSEEVASSVGPDISNEKHDPDDVSHKVFDFCVQSSTANTTHTTPLEDDPAHDVPMSEASALDANVNCSESPSDTLRCDIPSTEPVITDFPSHRTSENDVSSSKSVNTGLNPEVSTSHLPVLKNGKNDPPVSGDVLGSSSLEHNIHTSTSYTHDPPISMDMSSIAGAANTPPISKDHEHDNFASEKVKYSSMTNSNEISGSNSFRFAPSSNGHMGDTSKFIKRSSSTSKITIDASRSKSSERNATNGTSGHKGDASMPLHHSSSTIKNVMVGPTAKSTMKIASNARNLVSSLSGQKISGSLFSSSKSSLQTKDSSSFTSSVSQAPISNVATTQMAVPKIDNQKASELNGTNKRSGRSALQQPSPLKERASAHSTSHQKNSNYDTTSNAFHNVVSSLSTGFVLKASVRKVAQQLKGSKVSKQVSSRIINDGPGKLSKTLFPYESFVKLFNWDKLELPPCGLINCGNSCYANVVLQCLVFTRPIAAYLLQGSHSKTCQISQGNDWCFMCELQHLVSRMRDAKSPISPIRILSQLKNIGNHLGYGREEDAHEFLRFATEAMQSVCLAEAGNEMLIDSKLQETTLIQQIFVGSLYSKIKCLKCQYISERYDVTMDLMVEVDNEDIESLQDALAGFTAPEILDGAEKYYCGRCKTLVKAKKQLAVHEAPNILTIVLKRFQNGKFGKLNKHVRFPETLIMKPYMTGMGDKPPAYKLYAVVVHLDMMNASFSGHYVCYVKNLQGAWYKINDCKVKQVELDKVLSQRAYMLFYSRSSPRPPSILMNEIARSSMPVDASSLANASKKPVLKHGLEKISVLDTSPATSCAVDLEEYGFLSRHPSVRGNRIMGARDYMDWASSDSGSLFSCSDEASCSTESNRDSTSTDDYNETIFGDSGQQTCTGSGLPEDPYTLPSSFFCMKSSPPLQTEYYSQNNTYFQDSAFSDQGLYGDTYHHNRESDPVVLTSLDPTSQDTDGLPAWLSSSASSYFFPPSVTFGQRDSSSLDSDPSSICSHSLDFRTSNTNNRAEFSYLRNSNGAPDVSESGAHRQEDFVATTRSQSVDQKYMPGFLHESARLNFDVPSFNVATNLDNCLVHDTRMSDSLTAQSLGLDR